MSFAERLAANAANYDAAEAIGGTVPPGIYTGQVVTSRLEESDFDNDDTIFLNIHVKTDKGMAFGRLRLTNPYSEKSLGFTKGQLENLGYTGRLAEIESWAPSLFGASVEIRVSERDGEGEHAGKTFTEVNFRKIVGAPASVGFGQPEAFGQPAPAQGGFSPQQAGFAQEVQQAPAQQFAQPVQQQAAPQQAYAAPVYAPPVQQQPVAQPVAQNNLPFG